MDVRIGEVAERSGVSEKTLRYYEEIGVVEEPPRTPANYRDYHGDVLDRLAFIAAAQRAGLTLGEIRSVVALRDRGETPCAHVLDLIGRRRAEVDGRIAELKRMRTELEALERRGRTLDPRDCAPSAVCHVIAPSTGR